MNEPIQDNLHFNQKKQIRSFSTDKAELRNILEVLQERTNTAADIEIRYLNKNEEQSNEQFEKVIKDVRDGFKLFITLSGIDGRKLTGSIEDIFDSPNFPEEVKDIFFDSESHLRIRYNYYPRNKIILFIDFGRPSVLNFSILPSQETRNESNIEVYGKDVTWVNGVFQEFVNYVSQHSSTLPWLHRHSVYDLLLWVFGFPLSFWICSKFSHSIENNLVLYSQFLRSAFYVYIFLFSLILLRLAFHYARWIWPLTEYRSSRNKSLKHKSAFVTICLGLISTMLYDVLKWFIK